MKIQGHPDYLIFRNGAILDIVKKKFIKTNIGSHEYLAVHLRHRKGESGNDRNGRSTYLIHRLLAIHFIANKDSKKYVDHIDRNRLNNSLYNLRWVTAKENNMNKGMYKNNKSGYRNVYLCKRSNGFRYLGKNYKSIEEIVEKFSLVKEV
jgi:hypothetical protein